MVGRELVGMSAKYIARKLVEEDHAGEGSERIREELVHGQLTLLGPELQEVVLDKLIERRIGFPPIARLETEPEFENLGAPVLGISHAAVPPTVRPSISKVG